MYVLLKTGESEFLTATHSPILMTYPGAQIITFDKVPLAPTQIQDAMHDQITRGILEHPESC